MSSKIQTRFAVREMKIMEDCLKKMGYEYSNVGKCLIIAKKYNNIEIHENEISFDSDHCSEVEDIKFEYGKEFAITGIEQRGELYQVEDTKDELIIYVN